MKSLSRIEERKEFRDALTEASKQPSLVELATLLVQRIESELAPREEAPAFAEDDSGQAAINPSKLRRLVILDNLKQINSATEKLLAKLRAPLEEELLGMFEKLGTNNFNIDGRTVYLHREWWAKTAEGHSVEEALAALKACDETAVFVKESFNTQTLSAYFRERRAASEAACDAADEYTAEHGGLTKELLEAIPPLFPTPELANVLDFSEKTSVRSRQGGK